MTQIKPSHRAIALFFMCTFLQTLIPYNQLFANNNGPKSPEASSFEPVDATDMVNLLTGDLSYVLPLLNVPSPEGGYPLALSYHAGIAMDQEASWVGLGWNLNPGAINRSISGVPDDWKEGTKSSLYRDIGGEISNSSLSIGVGLGDDSSSIGVSLNWGYNRSFGGETNYNFGIGVSYNDANGNGANIGLSNNQISAGVGIGGVSYNSSTGFGITIANYRGISLNYSIANNGSTGLSLHSGSSGSFSIIGDSQYSTNTNNSFSLSKSPKFSAVLDLGIVRANFSHQKVRYWSFDEKTYNTTGSLYSGQLHEILNNKVLPYLHGFDASESLYRTDYAQEEAENNPFYISYDTYDVAGQGLTGSISPYLLDTGFLHKDLRQYSNQVKIGDNSFELRGIYNRLPATFSKYLGNPDPSENVYFYFNGTYASYHKTSADNIWEYQKFYDYISFPESVKINNTIDHSGYVANIGRLQKGNYVESFTNKQILENDFLILNDTPDRNTMDPNGIGAFKITALDGKTYHYTLPVYQKEKFNRSTRKSEDIENRYTEDQSLSNYATHWLLTGVTGPDFVDANNNKKLDENDYGYWVSFDYGKWSDGYGWRNPTVGYAYGEKSKNFSWGVKEIYYLNQIRTRTHTALFVKENRQDNKSSHIRVGTDRNNMLWRNAIYRGWQNGVPVYIGTDGKRYHPGAYSTLSSSNLSNPHNGYSVVAIDNGFYAETSNHSTLRLKEIILLKNENVPTTLKTQNSQEPIPKKVADFLFKEQVSINISNNGGEASSGLYSYVDNTYYGEFYNNVLDERDISIVSPSIKDNAEKIIKFNYTYSLAPESPNSIASGKTTLKTLQILNKGGASILPPYQFDYYNANSTYNRDAEDDWGFHKNNPATWSLRKITTPTGGKINITYESDEYTEEAAVTGRLFSEGLKFTLIKNESQNTLDIRIEDDENDDTITGIDFRDYFQPGKKVNIDLWMCFEHDYQKGGCRTRRGSININEAIQVVSSTHRNVVLTTTLNDHVSNERDGLNWLVDRTPLSRDYHPNMIRDELDRGQCANPTGCDGADRLVLKYKIIAKNTKKNKKGGGIRVKEISINEGTKKYKTTYGYNLPLGNANLTSGVTTFAPAKYQKEIPFSNYIPGPTVLYEYVTVKHNTTSKRYHFNVYKPYTTSNGNYNLGNALAITKEYSNQDDIPGINSFSGKTISVNTQKYHIKDNFSSIGSLLTQEEFNTKNQLLKKQENIYVNNSNQNKGYITESFNIYEQLSGNDGTGTSFRIAHNLGTTAKTKYSNVLKTQHTMENGFNQTTYFEKHDPKSGVVTETETFFSDNTRLKTKIIPAYTIPQYSNTNSGYGMGSKVDNPTHKNMLIQEAATLTQIKDGNIWKPVDASITTWNNNWIYRNYNSTLETPTQANEKIWRKHKTYVWKGEVDSNGAFVGFTGELDNFNWGINAVQSNPKWITTSTISQYDHFSMPLEGIDINANKTATKMTDDHTKIAAVGNAGYTELYYSGAEHKNKANNYLEDEIEGSLYQSTTKAHTGQYALKLNPGNQGFKVTMRNNEHRSGNYKFSVWVDANAVDRARIHVNGSTKTFNGERIPAGDWVLLHHYEDLSASQTETVYVTTASGTLYADDFRLHPTASSMTSYVYNKWDELTDVLGTNNLATHYEYDDAGRLIKTYVETVDTSTTTGGIKLVKQISYQYDHAVNAE